jgi:hypothetical protein
MNDLLNPQPQNTPALDPDPGGPYIHLGMFANAEAMSQKWTQRRQKQLIYQQSVINKQSEAMGNKEEENELNVSELNEDMLHKKMGIFFFELSVIQHFEILLQQVLSREKTTNCDQNVMVTYDEEKGKNNDELFSMKSDTIDEEDSKVDIILPDSLGVICGICREDVQNNDEDESGALIQLASCNHQAHISCLKQQLEARWAGKNISFAYIQCCECRTSLTHDVLTLYLSPHLRLKENVETLCRQQALADDENGVFANKLEENFDMATAECMKLFSCYICSTCEEPFCGGRVDCAQDIHINVSEMKCPKCAFNQQQKLADTTAKEEAVATWRGKCAEHGFKFAIYKCDSCCSVATWDCRSNHYCNRCHNEPNSHKDYPCPGIATCPLGTVHPPNKDGVHGNVDNGFVIGCSKCFLGKNSSNQQFELATDESSRGAVDYWKDRF